MDKRTLIAALEEEFLKLYETLDYEKALPVARKQVCLAEKALGHDHPKVAIALNHLAATYRALGEFAQAEPLFRRSLEIFEKEMDPDHPNVVWILNELAFLYWACDDHASAEPLFQRSLSTAERALRFDRPDVATVLSGLVDLFYRFCGHDKAVDSALERLESGVRKTNIIVGKPAGITLEEAIHSGYLTFFERSLAIMEKALDPNHPNVIWSLKELADLYVDLYALCANISETLPTQ